MSLRALVFHRRKQSATRRDLLHRVYPDFYSGFTMTTFGKMTIKNVFDHYVKSLSSLYEKSEAENISHWVIEDLLRITKAEMLLHGEEAISEVKANDLAWKLMRLMKGEPVQYVVGYTFFYGLKLKVNKSVLIPRPETEELVEWMLEDEKKKFPQKHRGAEKIKILDIGTGSGCIAIALKKNLPFADVYATDISEDALKVARENGTVNSVEINFLHHDILAHDSRLSIHDFDILVSNPPYIPQSDKSSLHKNVVGNEPHLALFAPDSDALIFYKAILQFAQHHLSKNGILYFEINPDKTEEVDTLLSTHGFKNNELRIDLSGKKRMIRTKRT
jgi:release factor glutamine methyltransferase